MKIILVIFLFLNLNGYCQTMSREWPVWFIHPAEFPEIITGYNYHGYSARNNAIDNYFLFRSCKVKGVLEYFISESPDAFGRNSHYKYFFVKDTLDHPINNLKKIDQFTLDVITGDYAVAFSLDTLNLSNKFNRLKEPLKKPEWIDSSFYSSENYYYGVGMYTSIGDDNDAWITAEERGIFSILDHTSILLFEAKTLESNNKGKDTLEKVIAYKLNYVLKNIKIMERYPDTKNNLYYALVRIKKNNLKILIK